MEKTLAPIEVFCSCSVSSEDTSLFEQLERHLSALRQEGLISLWHKRQIRVGSDWQVELDRHLNAASLILLLISPDFLASDYQYGVELQHAMERYNENEAHVIPILLRPCDWKGTPIEKLQIIPRNEKPLTLWRNRDEGFAEVTKEIRTIVKTMHRLTINAPSTTLPKIWQIPFARNPFFTGREHLLEQLHTHIQTMQAMNSNQPLAISGLGGIGKTQLAIEYAYRHAQEYQAVFWVRAETRELLNTGYTEIARLLNLPLQNAQEQEVIVQGVKAWLRSKEGWLLILDNVDDLNIVQTFLPTRFAGHLLLTTRAQTMGKLARRLEVDLLDRDVGALLLLRRAGLVEANMSFDAASPSDQSMALVLTEELGGLPLALDQAGAYIEETQCSITYYYQQYQMRRVELLAHRGMLVDDHPESVATTWSLSFEQVERANPIAAELLRICAFLAPDSIPEELLIEVLKTFQHASRVKVLRGWFSWFMAESRQKARPLSLIEGKREVDEAIVTLRAYSLVLRNGREKTLKMHRLTKAVILDDIEEKERVIWITRIIFALNLLFPTVSFVTWEQCARYLPQVQTCEAWITQKNLMLLEGASLLNRAGWYLDDRAQYKEAEPLLRRALIIREQLLGANHPDTANSLNNLALLYKNQGLYEQAEPLLVRALAINEQQLGTSHSDTASSLSNLALLYQSQGRYAEAEPLYKRSLTIREQLLGAGHPDTAISLNNLAVLYKIQEKYAEAESLYLRALAINEQLLGAGHPDTATSLNNLAALYKIQEKYAEAEALYLRALAINEQLLGTTHPDTATSLNNLAALYKTQEKYAEAEALYTRALTIREQLLGATHPDTASSLYNLAVLYKIQRKYAEAEPLYQLALSIYEQQLGTEHPKTQIVQEDYNAFLQIMEQMKGMEP